ncbi:c-type cytochrome [Grimontia marina]|uniref:Cytochrome c n=1 Tax=Grimontia marina TaxID=646534 RepID=A0A128FGP6_9GAMM|nr:c-type cytochrome [Grimontia marina]CZF85973.1 Cytochrome c [Grimontia marina]
MFRFIFAIMLGFISFQGFADDRKIEFILKNGDQVIFEKSLGIDRMKTSAAPRSLSFQSPVYKKPMTYNGLDFKDVAASAGVDFSKVEEIKFVALDGFVASWSKGTTKSPLVVVTDEKGNPNGFTDIGEGKETLNPGPFYVMTTDPNEYNNWIWPFQVYKIEFNYQAPKPDYYPTGAEDKPIIMAGYVAFKSTCISCHSINLEGGDIGPELNIPKNITEYRDKEYLKAFIKNPNSYRAKSRMLKFEHLSDQQLNEIIEYMAYMGSLKMLDKINE